MTTEKMTVHKALCELKTLEDRIGKIENSGQFAFANKHSNTKVNGIPIEEICEQIKSAYQSVTSLIARRDALKRAVASSNAKTVVTVGGKQYTVAEAIEIKNHGIPLKQDLLDCLSASINVAQSKSQKSNDGLEERADAYIQTLYAGADMKNLSDEIKKVRSDFIASQTMDIVDPINILVKIEKLEKEISDFTVEIDSALSVSNALTEITIEY